METEKPIRTQKIEAVIGMVGWLMATVLTTFHAAFYNDHSAAGDVNTWPFQIMVIVMCANRWAMNWEVLRKYL